jgi:Sec-independent protein translocase protein TatA
MGKTDWTTLLVVGLLVWVFLARLDRLGKAMDYGSYRIRREMAELLGKQDRVDELNKEWDQDEKEQRKERRREWIGFIILCAVALVWFVATQH